MLAKSSIIDLGQGPEYTSVYDILDIYEYSKMEKLRLFLNGCGQMPRRARSFLNPSKDTRLCHGSGGARNSRDERLRYFQLMRMVGNAFFHYSHSVKLLIFTMQNDI